MLVACTCVCCDRIFVTENKELLVTYIQEKKKTNVMAIKMSHYSVIFWWPESRLFNAQNIAQMSDRVIQMSRSISRSLSHSVSLISKTESHLCLTQKFLYGDFRERQWASKIRTYKEDLFCVPLKLPVLEVSCTDILSAHFIWVLKKINLCVLQILCFCSQPYLSLKRDSPHSQITRIMTRNGCPTYTNILKRLLSRIFTQTWNLQWSNKI